MTPTFIVWVEHPDGPILRRCVALTENDAMAAIAADLGIDIDLVTAYEDGPRLYELGIAINELLEIRGGHLVWTAVLP